MAKNNKADMSCARVKKYTASDVSKAERHNERKNETYENMNVIEERIPFNVHFKKPFAPTYMEQLKQMETNGLVSLRGLRKDATLFNEIVIDVNTMYFERNGGYEYAKQFYEEAYHFIEEKFGADNVISAVMHADEINVAATEELGKEVYHYHLHAIAVKGSALIFLLWRSTSMDRIFMDEYYEHLRADNIEAFSKERNDEYVGRAEEYKAAKLALLEGLGLEHLFDHSHELTPKEKEIWMLFDRVDVAELLARDAFAKGAYMLGAEDREIMLK